MKILQITPPTLEPITLSELKMHLRADSGSFDDNLTITQSMAFASHAIANNYTTHIGTGVLVAGKQAEVLLHTGTNGATGTNDTKIQESDDNITWNDWTGGAFTQITTANDNADYKKQYTGNKAYIRTVSKVLLAACEFGTSILCNEGETAEDDLLTAIIQAAREHIEDITRRQLLTATWDYFLDEFPSDKDFIKIPFGNLQDVSATQYIKYTDSDGTVTTLVEGTDYIWETNGEGIGRVVLPYGVSWPSFTAYTSNPIVIRFVCGYGDESTDVPSKIRTALKMIASDLYENRENQVISNTAQTYQQNKTVDRLLSSCRLWDEF